MTRAAFLAHAEHTVGKARANFESDGYLAPALIGIDARCRKLTILGVAPELLDHPDTRRAEKQGVHVVPMPMHEHTPELLVLLEQHRCVAATMINESWLVQGAHSADVLACGIPVAEHPRPRGDADCPGRLAP